jgi:hypothetical protein
MVPNTKTLAVTTASLLRTSSVLTAVGVQLPARSPVDDWFAGMWGAPR